MADILTDVTYDELVTLINTNALQPGLKYKLTFQTKHYILDYNGETLLDPVDGVTPVTNTGAVEHLIIQASSPNTLEVEMKSVEFPQDLISYDWNPANWLQDAAFCLDGATIIPGFKGVIRGREDTLQHNILGEDFRNIKYRRWKRNDPVWSSETTYAKGDKCQVAADGVYVSLVADNLNNLTTDTTKWVKIIDYAVSEYWCFDSSKALDITDYVDCKTFHEGTGSATYAICVKNNTFAQFQDDLVQFVGYTGSILNNNVFYLTEEDEYSVYDNKFGVFCECNTVAGVFNSNLLGSKFQKNSIGENFSQNSIWANFSDNLIYKNFGSNIIGTSFSNNSTGTGFGSNIIGTSFGNNIIGEGFGSNSIGASFDSNSVGTGFGINLIGANFQNNLIGVAFLGNSISSGFSFNTIGANFRKNSGISVSIDYTSANHVYAAYSCELFVRVDGTYKLRYCDNSDVLTVVNVNA